MTRAAPRGWSPEEPRAHHVATVMKADISGSTPLGERLDPEDLRRVLGSYFAALAREIHWHGGTVDKYIGDAVLAAFGLPDPRPDDAERAIRAGLAMQQAIERENVGLEARYGVRLACRIGIATGEVGGYPVNDRNEAIFSVFGETVHDAETLEAAAPLGSVLVSVATRDAAPDAFRYDDARSIQPKGGGPAISGSLVVGAGTAGTGRAGATGAGTSASLQVGGAREHVLAEERKIVTVLFADLSSDPPLTTLDQERLRELLGTYFGILAREIQRFGGTLDKYVGDAVMAVFGAPVSHEDDGARAIASALAIQDACRHFGTWVEATYGVRIAIRIGINTGEVVAGMLPGEVHAYTVTGDAVNTAQRIESAAPPGAIYVSASTRALARSAFAFEILPPLTLKGKSEPFEAFRVTGRERRASAREGTALVGRVDELARLYAAFREVATGAGRSVHVHGEAGVGKTRLVGEFLAGLSGAARLRARANSYEHATPYALVSAVFRRFFGVSSADTADVVRAAVDEALSPLSAVPREGATALVLEVLGYGESALDPQGKRRLAVAVLQALIRGRSEQAPLVLLLEDLHWADATSLAMLADIAASLGDVACLVLSTSREEADAGWAADRIGLATLDAEAAGVLVDRLSPQAVDPETRALIVERTAGNPFFIEEVVRAMRPGEPMTVPATVQDLLESRLDALDREPRRTVQAAAVVGRTFWERIVAQVIPDVETGLAFEVLAAERFVSEVARTPELTYSFVHALVQEVAYRTQLISSRRRSHVTVGDSYEQLFPDRLDELVDTLAFHYRRGDDDPKARVWLLRAGHRARRLYANTEALDYFSGAIERSTDDAVTRAEAEEALGDVHRVLAAYDEALARYAAARAALASDAAVARARLGRKTALIHQTRGKVDEALALIEESLAALPGDARAERARTLLAAADAAFRAGRHDDALARANEARAEAERASDEEALAEALKQLGTLHAYRGDVGEALRSQHESLAAYERVGDALGQANLHNNIGRSERRLSRHDAALDAYRESLRIRERIGDQLGRIHSHGNIAEVRFLRGELAEARREYEAILGLSQTIGYAFGVSAARVGLGATKAAEGDSEGAIADLAAAIDDFERTGQRTYTVEALRDLTDAYVVGGSPDAIVTAQRAVAVAREMALSELVAIALQALGKARLAAGDAVGAAAALEESRELLGTTGDRHELGRTLGLLGRAYARLPADDPRSATAAVLSEEARTILEELGAALDLRRLRDV